MDDEHYDLVMYVELRWRIVKLHLEFESMNKIRFEARSCDLNSERLDWYFWLTVPMKH